MIEVTVSVSDAIPEAPSGVATLRLDTGLPQCRLHNSVAAQVA